MFQAKKNDSKKETVVVSTDINISFTKLILRFRDAWINMSIKYELKLILKIDERNEMCK